MEVDPNQPAPDYPEPELPKTGFVVHIDAPWGGGKTAFANFLAGVLNPYRLAGEPPEWLCKLNLHDVGVWPERYRRAWHIVQFNAWLHQHVNPPWWVFYQTIRRQALKGLTGKSDLAERVIANTDNAETPPPTNRRFRHSGLFWRWEYWIRCLVLETRWRLFAPGAAKALFTFFIVGVIAYGLFHLGLVQIGVKGEFQPAPGTDGGPSGWLGQILTIAPAIILGGGAGLWSLVASFTASIMPGAGEGARNYSLGADDPLQRFRHHFARTMAMMRRPVLVLVDDLDRCEPAYVVELVRGMQTILQSGRVVFVLLGDRDWIEQAFCEVHKSMKGIKVGPEHEFGARFVEKAIQLSFVLPDISEQARRGYVRYLLRDGKITTPGVAVPGAGDGTPHSPSAHDPIEPSAPTPDEAEEQPLPEGMVQNIETVLAGKTQLEVDARLNTMLESDAVQDLSQSDRSRVQRFANRQVSARAATDVTAEEAVSHRLEALSDLLPANPRQIKRIINTISLVQEVARFEMGVQPGSKRWHALALWIVLMIEWPKTWFTLSKYPGITDEVHQPRKQKHAYPVPDAKALKHFADEIRDNKYLYGEDENCGLLRFTSPDDEIGEVVINGASIAWLAHLLPPTSGQMLDKPKPQKAGEEN